MKALPDAIETEPHQPIAVVAERTGLSQDVLRAWERRYDAVRPTRDAGGQRQYTDADIRRLRLLHAATRAGRNIGSVASLSTDQIASLVDGDLAVRESVAAPAIESPVASDTLEEALALSRALDAAGLDEALRRAAATMGVTSFIETVAAPLLRRIGDEWHAGRLAPPQEHLVTTVLHDIIVATMRAFPQRNGAPKVLVATPAGDRHSIGAALVGAASALEGWTVLYLGADLPSADIADAAKTAGVRVVALSIVYTEDRARVLGEVRALRARLPADIILIAGGAGATSLAPELAAMDVRVESSMSGLAAELRRHRHAG